MESTQIQALYEPPLAAMPQLREKPRQGFETWKTAWKPGPNVPNFTVALGLRAVVVENGVRGTYSARYYNPATGRFLSRDPEDGYTNDPASLHKYLYANGDPVNLADPTGRAGEAVVKPYTPGALEYGLLIGLISLQAAKSLPQLSGGINDLWYSNTLNLIGYMFATKRDVKQARDAGKQVGRERGCRSPEPDDFETAHDMMESEKGPNGMVTYEQLLEIWREILCGGGR